MKEILFPKNADNNYKGHKLAKWVLYLYVIKSFFSGCVHMFAADGGAQSIASITLDSFTQGGADSVITMFAYWGMEQFLIGLIAVVVLWRYKSLIPMIWGVYAIEYSARYLLKFITPGVATVHTPPGAVADYVLVPIAIGMFLLALLSSRKVINGRQKN